MSGIDEEIKTISEIDKIVHSPIRLSILSILYLTKKVDFIFIMNQLNVTKGNLSSHLTKLEEKNYITISKTFVKKIPRTLYSLTSLGEKKFEEYISQMSTFILKFS